MNIVVESNIPFSLSSATLSADGSLHITLSADVACLPPGVPAGGFTPYRTVTEGYHNRAYHNRGKKRSESISDTAGHMYDETLYDITVTDLSNGLAVGDTDCPLVSYPTLEITVTNHYEGNQTPLMTTAKRFVYDDHRNVTLYVNLGDTNYTGDELCMAMEYSHGNQRNMVSLRTSASVHAGKNTTGALFRKSTFEYYNSGGLRRRGDFTDATTSVFTTMAYDAFGNLDSVAWPPNHAGHVYWRKFVYDGLLHTLPVKVRDAYLRESRTTWHYRFQKPLSQTDVAGSTVYYTYDKKSRLVSVLSPKEHAANRDYTWQAVYYNGCIAHTFHFDPQHPTDPIQTTTICDGWGRPVQVKRDLAIGGQARMQVSGRVKHDALGRPVNQYDPRDEAPGTAAVFNSSYGSLRTSTVHDILDRGVACTTYHNSPSLVETTAYSYQQSGGRTLLATSSTDALGRTSTTLADAHGNVLSATDAAGGTTAFTCDQLGQRLSSTDPDGFTTSYTYDLLGRPTGRTHPDGGTTSTVYDAAGNVIRQTNAAGETTVYSYNFLRMETVSYPRLSRNNVDITYDVAGRPSIVTDGSGCRQYYYDDMGNVTEVIRTMAVPFMDSVYTFSMQFGYDSWNRATYIEYPDHEVVEYHYDIGGNLQSMDGHKGSLQYNYISNISYDCFGDRTRVEYEGGAVTDYARDDLRRLTRLTTQTVVGGVPVTVQDISYTFDAVGNITVARNSAPAVGALGGGYINTYTYDALDRLTYAIQGYGQGNSLAMRYSASGRVCQKSQQFTGRNVLYGYLNNNKPHAPRRAYDGNSHTLTDMQWDACGNLAQISKYITPNSYDGSRYLFWSEDNRLTNVVDRDFYSYYGYDSDGERTLKLTGTNSMQVVNAETASCTPLLDKVTLYMSSYLVAGNHGYTKHYYAGTERVAARKGGGGIGSNQLPLKEYAPALSDRATALFNDCNNAMASRQIEPPLGHLSVGPCEQLPTEATLTLRQAPMHLRATTLYNLSVFRAAVNAMSQPQPSGTVEDLYIYHSDHLGSASWITDGSGQPVQHLQYLPFGEPFVNQRLAGSTYNERFTFTGKERDAETGYGYFGARYMDYEFLTSFLSVDRYTDRYPTISPYAYCAWNPIRLSDPSGDSITLSKEAWNVQKEAFLSIFNRKENNIPFSFNEENKKMYYSGENSSYNYSETQKKIIEHYKTLCESDYDITVHVVKNDDIIKTAKGYTTLKKELAHGLTVNHGDNTADVYISKRPLYRFNGEIMMHPQTEAHQSITILHEIGGHAYYYSQKTFDIENNRLTSEFENMCRDIFIGKNRLATREIRKGRASETH